MRASRVRFFFVACLVLGASAARADAPRLTATGIFGNDALTLTASNDVIVRVQTDPLTGFAGEIRISSDDVTGAGLRTTSPLFMGPSQTRELVVAVPAMEGAYRMNVALVTRGRVVATAFIDEGESMARTFVVLADPPRIRAAADAVAAYHNAASTSYEKVTVGVVGIERRSGDPRVPRSQFGWARTALVVASAQALEQVDRRGMDALLAYVEGGGAIVVFPRDDEDVHGPAVRALTGPLVQGVPHVLGGSAFLPDGVAPCRYEGAHVVRAEDWGTTIARGFGSVHVACFDGNAPQYAHAITTQHLLDALRRDTSGPHPLFMLGESSRDYAGGAVQPIELLRRALDANEGARPVLPFVAILLIGYVVLVGPLGFRFAEKRGRPTLALLTTPLLALACLTVLLVTGAIAKGFRHRARSAALVEVVAGESRAVERRITGIFFGRPASPDLVAPRDAMVTTTRDEASGTTLIDVSGERPVVRAFRGGLWSTRLLRTDRTVDLGGPVTPRFDGTRLVSVANGSRQTMHSAVVVDGRGVCHRVGKIASGAERAVSVRGTTCAPAGTVPYNLDSDVLSIFSGALGLARRDTRLLNGLVAYAGYVTDSTTLTLYARLDPSAGIETSAFESERELRLLRVVVRGPRSSLSPVVSSPAEAPASDPPAVTPSAVVDAGAP